MREFENIKNIVNALDIDKQFEKAETFIKTQGINNPFYDGFYGHTVDIVNQIEQFKRDYSGSPLVICFLSLEKSKKAYTMIDGAVTEIDPPIAQEKTYVEVSGRNSTNRVTNFYSIKYLEEIAKQTGLKLQTFEFGKTIIHLSILYDDLKPVEEVPNNPDISIEITPPVDPIAVNENQNVDEIINKVLSLPESEEKPKEKIKSKIKGDK